MPITGRKPHTSKLRKLSKSARDGVRSKKKRAISERKGKPSKPASALVPEDAQPLARPAPVRISGVPESVAYDKIAADFYKKTYKALAKMKILSEDDVAGVEAFSLAYARAREAEAHVRDHGAMLKDVFGWKVNPAVLMARQQWQEVRKWMVEFGFTPASRTRIAQLNLIPGQSDEEEAVDTGKGKMNTDEFLFGKGKHGRVVGVIGA